VQKTLNSSVCFSGVGLHTGKRVNLTIQPATEDFGIWFCRTDIKRTPTQETMIPALWSAVEPSELCTKLGNASGVGVSTIEHLMAALSGCGVHNALIELDAPELPILDGSAVPFVRKIMECGVRTLDRPVLAMKVMKAVRVSTADAFAMLAPSASLHIDFHIDFSDVAIGQQTKSLSMNNGAFVRELSDSRTFCRKVDVEKMLASGLALGGTPGENAVVFDGSDVISPGGLRHVDEPVRHKMLDAIGDLALAGGPLLGHYTGYRAGHALTNTLLRKFFSIPGAVEKVPCDHISGANLPGVDLRLDEIPANV